MEALPAGDKLGHFFLYGMIAWVSNWAISAQWQIGPGVYVPYGALLAVCIASLEEVSQIGILNRTANGIDLLCSAAGVCIFSIPQMFQSSGAETE